MKLSNLEKTIGLTVFLSAIALAALPWIYGLYLAFSASIVLGVIVLLIEPSPWFVGIVGFFNPLVCEKIAGWLGLK